MFNHGKAEMPATRNRGHTIDQYEVDTSQDQISRASKSPNLSLIDEEDRLSQISLGATAQAKKIKIPIKTSAQKEQELKLQK
jgi:hypothetical protein